MSETISTMNNLSYLDQHADKMGQNERRVIYSYIVGAVSAHIPESKWVEIINSAISYAKRLEGFTPVPYIKEDEL